MLGLAIGAFVLVLGAALTLFILGYSQAAINFLTGSGFTGFVVGAATVISKFNQTTGQLRDEQRAEQAQRRRVQDDQSRTMRRMNLLLKTYETRITAISTDLDSSEKRSDKLEERLKAALELTDNQRQTIDDLREENRQQALAMLAMQREINSLKAQLTTNTETITALTDRVAELVAILALKDKAIADLERRTNQALQTDEG